MYFLVATYGNLNINYPPLAPQIIICIDVDNNTTTGTTPSGYCNDMPGVDRRITANLRLFTVAVERWTGATWAVVPQPGGGMRAVAWDDTIVDGIADLPYIEIGVDLQSLGITSSATCLSAMPTAIYYDNGMADPEDTVLDSGTFSIGCGTPTAVTLSEVDTQPAAYQWAALAVGAVSLVGVGAAVFFALRKRRKAQI